MQLEVSNGSGGASEDPGVHAQNATADNDSDYIKLQYGVFRLTAPSSLDDPLNQYACPNFLDYMRSQLHAEAPEFYWEYDMRQQAQPILPFLYLGPVSAARDVEFLRTTGITLVYGIRSKHPTHKIIVNADVAAQMAPAKTENVEIGNTADLIENLPTIIRKINDHVCVCPQHATPGAGPKKVLLFCETGNERSAAVAVGYLMVMFRIRSRIAVGQIQNRRLSANIDYPTKNEISKLDGALGVQRADSPLKRRLGADSDQTNPPHKRLNCPIQA